MDQKITWASLFFSGDCPTIPEKNELPVKCFRPFSPEVDNWKIGPQIDGYRRTDATARQVFWIRIKGHRKYVAKVFPDYTKQDAKLQLIRLRIVPTPERVEEASYDFDRFHREARVYNQIDQCCSARERIYFPQFFGVLTKIPRSRFASGYHNERAIMLEVLKPELCSRRILSEHVPHLSKNFLTIFEALSEELSSAMSSLSLFEQDWYRSLLKDRLRRLDTLHRIGVTHSDLHDVHFRLPKDFYDTVLYDFSASYTFTKKRPFRVNWGKPRPLDGIATGERERVCHDIQDRAISRDFRSYLIDSNPEASTSIDNALWQSLEEEQELLELMVFKASHRPDGFSMPTLNSIFPFIEAICLKSDPCWHIRRGRLLHHYQSIWVVFRDDEAPAQSIAFDCEPQFGSIETMKDARFMLCLIPSSWIVTFGTSLDFVGSCKLREFCSHLVSARFPGLILNRDELLGTK